MYLKRLVVTILVTIIFVFSFDYNGFSQQSSLTGEFNYGICIKSIAFKGGPDVAGFIEMHNDETEARYNTPTSITDIRFHPFQTNGPSCTSCSSSGGGGVDEPDPNGLRSPGVAMVAGSYPHVGACFETDCSETVWIRATWDLGSGVVLSFEEEKVTPDPIVGPGAIHILRYDFKKSNLPFPAGQARAFERAQITFEFTHDVNGASAEKWNIIDTDGPDVYITSNMPLNGMVNNAPMINIYTSIRNSCVAGNLTSSKQDLLNGIFANHLSSKDAKQGKRGDVLTYWATPSTLMCFTLKDFFRLNDGRCGLWAAYLGEMLDVHGYSSDLKYVFSKPFSLSISEVNEAVNAVKLLHPNQTVRATREAFFVVVSQPIVPLYTPYAMGIVSGVPLDDAAIYSTFRNKVKAQNTVQP